MGETRCMDRILNAGFQVQVDVGSRLGTSWLVTKKVPKSFARESPPSNSWSSFNVRNCCSPLASAGKADLTLWSRLLKGRINLFECGDERLRGAGYLGSSVA